MSSACAWDLLRGLVAGLFLLAAPVALAETYRAPPPGGVDDTQALQHALDRCVPGGHDCEVRLPAGTYRTRQLFASGFHGSVRGAGMEATVIEAIAPLDVSVVNGEGTPTRPGGVYAVPPSLANPYPFLLTFVGGSDFSLSDLTLSVPGSPATNGWFLFQDAFVDWMNGIYVEGDGRVERVGFDGSPDPNVGNVNNAVQVASGKVFELKSSRVRASCADGFQVFYASGVRVNVEGNSFEGGSAGGAFPQNDGISVRYSHNRVTGANCGYALLIQQVPATMAVPGRPSSYAIHDNLFVANGDGSNGVYIDDPWVNPSWGGLKTIDVSFVENSVQVTGYGASGMWMRWLKDALIAENRFSGDGCVGTYAGRVATSAVLENDLRRFSANSDCGLPAPASILLNSWTHDTLVAGNRTPDGVVDLGTNNKVVGNR